MNNDFFLDQLSTKLLNRVEFDGFSLCGVQQLPIKRHGHRHFSKEENKHVTTNPFDEDYIHILKNKDLNPRNV